MRNSTYDICELGGPKTTCKFMQSCLPCTLTNKCSRLSAFRHRLSRIIAYLEVKNPVPVLTWKSNNIYQNIVEKRRNCSLGAISSLFHNIFNISLNIRSQITYSFIKCGCSIYCFPQFRKSDMSRYGYLEVFHRISSTSR